MPQMPNGLELLDPAERADLDRVIGGRSAVSTAAAVDAYVSGRVAGLCREGALELAADAARVADGQAGGVR